MIQTLLQLTLWAVGRRRRFRITGNSMRPELVPGDQVLVDPRAYHNHSPVVGDLVLARHPYRRDIHIVKRVHGHDPSGRVRVHGENASESTDSRIFGALPRALILGCVVLRLPVGSAPAR